MISKEERESIINEAMERTLLKIPDVVGNLISNYASKIRLKEEFYNKHPEFKDHKDIVASVIENIENENSSMDIGSIIDKAVPVIRGRISLAGKLDMKNVNRPNTKFDHGDI